jgi:hypothetical protein
MMILAGSNFSPSPSSLAITAEERTSKKRLKTATCNNLGHLMHIIFSKFFAKITMQKVKTTQS